MAKQLFYVTMGEDGATERSQYVEGYVEAKKVAKRFEKWKATRWSALGIQSAYLQIWYVLPKGKQRLGKPSMIMDTQWIGEYSDAKGYHFEPSKNGETPKVAA